MFRSTTAVRYALTVFALWLALSAAAAYVWNQDFWFPFYPIPSVARGFLAGGFLATLSLECAVLVLLCCAAATLHARNTTAARRSAYVLRAAAWIITTLIIFVTLIGWIMRSYGQPFPTGGVVVNAILDFSSIRQYLSLRESLIVAGGLLLAIMISAILVATAPKLRPKHFITLGFVVVQSLMVLLVSLYVPTTAQLDQLESDQFRGLVSAGLTPTTSLFWSPLLYGNPDRNAKVTLPLTPRFDLDAYARDIEPNVRHPNIIVFMVEALRAGEVTRIVNGRPVMPASKQLAERGLNFDRAYAQANESAYSAHSLISGLFPLKSSQRDSFREISYPLLRIPDVLSRAYHTAYVSSIDERWQGMLQTAYTPSLEYFLHAGNYTGDLLPPDPADDGFREAAGSSRTQSGALDDAVTVKLLQDWVRKQLHDPEGRPFYAMTYLHASHFPYEQSPNVPHPFTPSELSARERGQLSFVFYPPELSARMRNRYWNSLAYIDAQIASTVDLLEQEKALDNTIIVIIGDHGELFYENGHVTHAASLYDPTLHVSFVISGSASVPSRRYSDPVSSFDLGPMLLHFADMPAYPGFQGSIPPGLLANSAISATRPIFSSVQAIAYEDSVLGGSWRYTEQADAAYAKLYNVQQDPLEQHKLDAHSPLGTCLRDTLHQFRSNQIGYFTNPKLTANFFPPQHTFAPSCTPLLADLR